ncbi:hypothetical protein A5787_03605 [Mycobacterium sp. 852002-50816_SCH5313054-b]|uniref:hypothetical protein n=1 Tax=Mycobacterium sp. 852002-50816_SCH5313054-b TaxID=1834092 RepID=UPI000801FFDC|nr:hypothetical protein [Mycobacterium sp. 852002-50816_SCH5313054-b]OBF55099.1 hypothetical protein A5787_03605 [Mycobacterium sp. 852002-50816_SCH5313054-b]
MEQSEPEDRIADLEPALPETTSGVPKPARTGPWTQIVALFGILCVAGGLVFLRPALVPDSYGYLLGTPTTATIEHCGSGGGTCDGRWSVGGASQTGPILGVYDRRDRVVGSQKEVHVHDATAYTASYARLIYPAMSGGFIAFAAGVLLLWSARRKFTTGNWPLFGHRSRPPV